MTTSQPGRWSLDEIKHMTFARVAACERDALLLAGVWEAYCYLWRDSTSRFSDLGKREAARHAAEHGLELPRSDRPVG